jgi:transposase InsO family protein
VNVHKNAVLTPRGREQFTDRIDAGESVAGASAAVGVSERTGWKWLGRRRAEGLKGLVDRSSRPHRSPNRVRRTRERQVVRLRRKRWTQAAIAEHLAMPLSTVGAVCRRHEVGRLRDLEPRPPVVRYERENAGELVHLDIKKLARIERIGHRIHGDRSRRSVGAGWECTFVAVDDCTRLAYAEVLASESAPCATKFLRHVIQRFGNLGIRIERVLTDNAKCYGSQPFRALCQAHGIRQVFTRPYTPRTNGKAERFIQTMTRRWAYRRPYRTSAHRTAALRPWLTAYNHERPHRALGMRPPMARLREARQQRV